MGELVETSVDVADDVVVHFVLHTCGAWLIKFNLVSGNYADILTL